MYIEVSPCESAEEAVRLAEEAGYVVSETFEPIKMHTTHTRDNQPGYLLSAEPGDTLQPVTEVHERLDIVWRRVR